MNKINERFDTEKLNKRPITNFFLNVFYKKRMATDNEKRSAIGKWCGLLGIICNTVLSACKILAGILTSSISIIADGLNNMSDAGSSILTLLGFKLAEKPADKDHPYGHARYEYLASLLISVIIFFLGFELIKTSIENIISPDTLNFSLLAVIVLGVSIIIKIFLSVYSYQLSKIINSDTLKGISIDSRNDVITTSLVLIALLVQYFTGIYVDGYVGCAVAIFIIFSAFSLMKDTISPLLGEGANKELTQQIEQYVKSFDKVLGCHDLLVHDYGPGNRFASLHVEMDKNQDALACHEILDEIERKCLKDMGIHLVIHYDPIEINNPEAEKIKKEVYKILNEFDKKISVHDFRLTKCDDKLLLRFDATIHNSTNVDKQVIVERIENMLFETFGKTVDVDITFDVATYD